VKCTGVVDTRCSEFIESVYISQIFFAHYSETNQNVIPKLKETITECDMNLLAQFRTMTMQAA